MANRKDLGTPLELGGNTNYWEDQDIFAESNAALAKAGEGDFSTSQGFDLSKDMSKEEANQLLSDSTFIQDIYDFYYERDGKTFSSPDEAIDTFMSDRTAKNMNTLHIAAEMVASGKNTDKQNGRLARMQKVFDALPNFYQEGGDGAAGLYRNLKYLIMDPANLIGFGAGGLAAKAAMRTAYQVARHKMLQQGLKGQALKKGIKAEMAKSRKVGVGPFQFATEGIKKQALVRGASVGAAGEAVASGIVEGSHTHMQQNRNLNVGLQNEYSKGTTALGAMAGGVLGGAMGGVFGAAGARLPLPELKRLWKGKGLKFSPNYERGILEGAKDFKKQAITARQNLAEQQAKPDDLEVADTVDTQFDAYGENLRLQLSGDEEAAGIPLKSRVLSGTDANAYKKQLDQLVKEKIIDDPTAHNLLEKHQLIISHEAYRNTPAKVRALKARAAQLQNELGVEGTQVSSAKHVETSREIQRLNSMAEHQQRNYDKYHKEIINYHEGSANANRVIKLGESARDIDRVDGEPVETQAPKVDTEEAPAEAPLVGDDVDVKTEELALSPELSKRGKELDDAIAKAKAKIKKIKDALEGKGQNDAGTTLLGTATREYRALIEEKNTLGVVSSEELARGSLQRRIENSEEILAKNNIAYSENRNATRNIRDKAKRADRVNTTEELAALGVLKEKRELLKNAAQTAKAESKKAQKELDAIVTKQSEDKPLLEKTNQELEADANKDIVEDVPTLDENILRASNTDEEALSLLNELGFDRQIITRELRVSLKGLKDNARINERRKYIERKVDEFLAEERVTKIFELAETHSKIKSDSDLIPYGETSFLTAKIRSLIKIDVEANTSLSNIQKANMIGSSNRYYDEYLDKNAIRLFSHMVNELGENVPLNDVAKEIQIRFGMDTYKAVERNIKGGKKQSMTVKAKSVKEFLKEIQPLMKDFAPHERRMMDRAILKLRNFQEEELGRLMDDSFIRAALKSNLEKIVRRREGGQPVFQIARNMPASKVGVDDVFTHVPVGRKVITTKGQININGKMTDVSNRMGGIQSLLQRSNRHGYNGNLLEEIVHNGEKVTGESAALIGLQNSWLDAASNRMVLDEHKFIMFDSAGGRTNKISDVHNGGRAEGVNAKEVLILEDFKADLLRDRLAQKRYEVAIEPDLFTGEVKKISPPKLLTPKEVFAIRQQLEKSIKSGGIGLPRMGSLQKAGTFEKVMVSNKEVTAPLYPDNVDASGLFVFGRIDTGEKVTKNNRIKIDGVEFKKIRRKWGTKIQSIEGGYLHQGRIYRDTSDIPGSPETIFLESRDALLEVLSIHRKYLTQSMDIERVGNKVQKQRESVDFQAYSIMAKMKNIQRAYGDLQYQLDKGEIPKSGYVVKEQQIAIYKAQIKGLKDDLTKIGKLGLWKNRFRIRKAATALYNAQDKGLITDFPTATKEFENTLGVKLTDEDKIVARHIADKQQLEDSVNRARQERISEEYRYFLNNTIDEKTLTERVLKLNREADAKLSDVRPSTKPKGSHQPMVVEFDGIEVDVNNHFQVKDGGIYFFGTKVGDVLEKTTKNKTTFELASGDLKYRATFSGIDELKRSLPELYRARVLKAADDGLLRPADTSTKNSGKNFLVKDHTKTNTYRGVVEEPEDVPVVDNITTEPEQYNNPVVTRTVNEFSNLLPEGRNLAVYIGSGPYEGHVRIPQEFQQHKPLSAILGKQSNQKIILGHTDARESGTSIAAQRTFQKLDEGGLSDELSLPEYKDIRGGVKRNTMLDDPDIVNPKKKPLTLDQAYNHKIIQEDMPDVNPPIRGLYNTLGDVLDDIANYEKIRWDDARLKTKEDYAQFINRLNFLYSIVEREAPHGVKLPNISRSQSLNKLTQIMNKVAVGRESSNQLVAVMNVMRRMAGGEEKLDSPNFIQDPNGYNYYGANYRDPVSGETYNKLQNAVGVGLPEDSGVTKVPEFAKVIHELGHWSYANILSPSEKRTFWDAMSKYIDQEGVDVDLLKEKLPGSAKNQIDSPGEFFAEQFVQYALHNQKAGSADSIASLWRRIAETIQEVIGKMFGVEPVSGKVRNYVDPDLIPLMERIFPDDHKVNRYIKTYERWGSTRGRTHSLVKQLVDWDDIKIKLEHAIDQADNTDGDSIRAVLGGRADDLDKDVLSDVLDLDSNPLMRSNQTFLSQAWAYTGKENSRFHYIKENKTPYARMRLLDSPSKVQHNADGTSTNKYAFPSSHKVRSKLIKAYYDVKAFQQSIGVDRNKSFITYLDPEKLKRLSDGEDIARANEVEYLTRSQEEGGLPEDYVDFDGGDFSDTSLVGGGNTPLSRAATGTAETVDDVVRSKMIANEILAVIADVQKDMREQLTRTQPKNSKGESIKFDVDNENKVVEIATKESYKSSIHRKRNNSIRKKRSENQIALAKRVIADSEEIFNDKEILKPMGDDLLRNSASPNEMSAHEIIAELSVSKKNSARSRDLLAAFNRKINTEPHYYDNILSKRPITDKEFLGDTPNEEAWKALITYANGKVAETPDEYLISILEAFKRGDDLMMERGAAALKRYYDEHPLLVPKNTDVQRYIDTEITQTTGVSGENGIPANTPIHIKELLRKITHRDRKVENTSRTLTYRLVNMLSATQRDYLGGTNFLTGEDFNKIFPQHRMKDTDSGVVRHVNDSVMLNDIRKTMRKLGGAINWRADPPKVNKDGTASFVGLRENAGSSYTAVHEVGHILYRGTFNDNNKASIVQGYEEAILSQNARAVDIQKTYGNKYDGDLSKQAEEWFVDGFHDYLSNRAGRQDRFAKLTNSGRLGEIIDELIEKVAYMFNGLIGSKSIKQNYRFLTYYGDMLGNRGALRPVKTATNTSNSYAVRSVIAPRYARETIDSFTPSQDIAAREFVIARSDEDLFPYVKYHGTINGRKFDKTLNPDAVLEPSGSNALYGRGIYLTDDPKLAADYSREAHHSSLVKLIDDNITNPTIRERGYDIASDVVNRTQVLEDWEREMNGWEYHKFSNGSKVNIDDLPADIDGTIRVKHTKKLQKLQAELDEAYRRLSDATGVEPEGKVLPLFVRANKIMDFTEKTMWQLGGENDLLPTIMELNTNKLLPDKVGKKLIADIQMRNNEEITGSDFYGILRDALTYNRTELEAKEAITAVFRAMGYDAFRVTETDRLTNDAIDTLIVFDSSQVKHVDAKKYDSGSESMFYNSLNRSNDETPAGSAVTNMVELGRPINAGDHVYAASNAQNWGMPDGLQRWFRKTLKREPLDADDVDALAKQNKHQWNFLQENSAHARRIGARWFADKVKPSDGGPSIFQKNTADMAKIVRPLIDDLMSLPDAPRWFKQWLNKTKPLLSPLEKAGWDWAAKVPTPPSHRRILKALRQDNVTSLNPNEQRIALDIANAFKKELDDLRAAGVPIGDVTLRTKKYYVPQQWDSLAVQENPAAFIRDLKEWIIRDSRRDGQEIDAIKADAKATEIHSRIISEDGKIDTDDVLHKRMNSDPFYRRFINLNPDDVPIFEKYMVNDLAGLVTRYFDKTVRKKLLAQEFGVGGHALASYQRVAREGIDGAVDILKSHNSSKVFLADGDDVIKVDNVIVPVLKSKTHEQLNNFISEQVSYIHSGDGTGLDTRRAFVINKIMSEYDLGSLTGPEFKNLKHRVEGIVNALADFPTRMQSDNAKWITKYIDVLNKRPINGGDGSLMKWSRRARAFNSVTLLSWTTLTSIPDIGLPLVRSGNLGAFLKAYKQIASGNPSYKQAARDIGVGIENLVHDRMTHMAGDSSQQFSNGFFNATMLTPWTNFQREISALVGFNAMKAEIDNIHRIAQQGDQRSWLKSNSYKTSVRFLKSLGLHKYAQPNGPRLDDITKHTNDDAIRYAVMKFTNETIFTPDPNDVPLWAQTPWGAMIFQLKSFPLMMQRLLGKTLTEANVFKGRKWNQKDLDFSKGNFNFLPLTYLMTVGITLGMTANAVKDIVFHRGGEDERSPALRERNIKKRLLGKIAKDHFGVNTDNWDDEDWAKWGGWIIDGMLAMGGMGLIAESLYNSASQVDNGAYGRERMLSLVLGPTMGAVMDGAKVLEGAWNSGESGSKAKARTGIRSTLRRIPVAGSIKTFTEGATEALVPLDNKGSGSNTSVSDFLLGGKTNNKNAAGDIAKFLLKN